MDNNNSWIDIPVVEAIEYFGGVLAQAYKWANRYALLFGLIGIIWSGYKLMMSRTTVKDFLWDTLFKWIGFMLLMSLYPSVTVGISAIGHQIGMNAGAGKQTIVSGLKNLRTTIKQDLKTQKSWAEGLDSELRSKFDGLHLDARFDNSASYTDYMNKVSDEIGAFRFSSNKDKKEAQRLVEEYKDRAKYRIMFGARTLSALERVLVEKEMDGSAGDDLTETYVDLDIYLRDEEGNETYYISPSALLKVALLSCQIMFEKENTQFMKVSDDIDDLHIMERVGARIETTFARIPQMIMMFFCCIVLIVATIFAEIQYVMTILEYTIIVGIGAIFIPFMLFDGTKDVPKKFIPVFISFMVKMIVITICIMFVYYLLIENCINTIADDGGMNWVTVGEIFFDAILCYILTQNAPKIAQTILTGQPQLSMGEALQGAGTALMTAATMKQAPHAAAMAAAKGKANLNTVGGAVNKSNAASRAAVASLGENATARQKFKAAAGARYSVATQDLKDRMRAKFEAARKEQGTGIGIVDKAASMAGLQKSAGAVGGGAEGSSPAYGVTGQFARGADGKVVSYSAHSNPEFSSATKYDPATKSQRSMTNAEFQQEKSEQGRRIGEFIGQQMSKKIEAQNQKKAGQDGQGGMLPDNLSGNERAFDK
ncbi:MAG: type IV secretion system protein [Treponemataceae bacterium]|nr:type IV secretion system protein [Treponemataceae bacterium]